MKSALPALRWTIVLLLTIVVAFEFVQTVVAAVSAEDSTAAIFFAAIASIIVGLPNKRHRTLTGLTVFLGSIASVALAGLWSPGLATASSFFVVCGQGVSLVLGREDIYPFLHGRASILIATILLASVAFSSHGVTWRSEYVKNGSFDQGFDGWTMPMTRYPGEFVSNSHWYLPQKNCLTLAASSRKGLAYDSVAVFQPLDAGLSWGFWQVSGYMGNVDVRKECDVLATSVSIVLRDDVGMTRHLKYVVLVTGELASNSVEGVVVIGRGEAHLFDFSIDMIHSIQEVWNISYVIGWKVVGVELLVEFRNNWGSSLHLEAIFDEISLRRQSDARWLVHLAGFASWWLPLACLPALVWTHSRLPREKISQRARSESVP